MPTNVYECQACGRIFPRRCVELLVWCTPPCHGQAVMLDPDESSYERQADSAAQASLQMPPAPVAPGGQ